MTQNSVSISMTKLRNDAFLAEAGYENMGGEKIKKGKIISNDQTGTEFEVIDQKRDNNGFDMTIFKEVGTDNYVISYRGTEKFSLDDHSNNIKMHFGKINEQAESAKIFTAMYMKEILEKNPNAKFTTTGHSQGGEIVQQMAYEFGLEGTAFNPYGAKGVIGNLADFDSDKFEQNKDKVLNVKLSTDKIGQMAEDYGNTITIDAGKLLSEVYNKDLSYSPDCYFPDEGTLGIGASIYDWVRTFMKGHPIAEVIKALNMSKEQLEKFAKNSGIDNISLYDPIALDLNANGKIDTLSLENGVFFDHNGDGIAFKSSWISGEDGILARDINGDDEINSGAELFGNFTKLKNGELAKNGAEALKDLDDNNDGIFDSNDKAFNEILVWQDKNSDGISQKNELKTLNEHNIKSIDLEFMADNTALDKDNKQILIGSFSTNISNESKNNLASDIDFSVDTIQRNILDDTDGIIKGTGFVRNFNLSLNDEIKNAYESYKTLNTKQQQLSNVETLVNLWAKTAKQYKEIDNPIQKVKINISSVASNTTSSGINEAIKRANNNEITINDEILSNEGNIITSNENAPNSKSLTPGQALALYEFKISDTDSAKIKELATKAAVVSVFSGKENKVLYVSSNEEVKSAIQSIEKAYDSITSYVYKSLLVSTRLDKYAKNIEVNMALNDDNAYEFALNFDKVAMQFKENLQTSAADALIDYIEFNAIYNDKNLKKAVESILIKQAIENKEFLESLALLDEEQKSIILNTTQKILAQNIVTDTEYLTQITDNLNIKILKAGDDNSRLNGLYSNDVLLGGNGKDYLYGENGDDILIGGSGNDYLNGSRGNDTYVFGKNWGVDSIYNYDSYRINDDSKDIIEFKDGIKLSDLSFSSNSNYDLIITQGNNKIIAEYALGDNYYKIDKVRFDDNTEIDFEQIKLLSTLASKNADII